MNLTKKYKLTNYTMTFEGRKLYRIRRLSDGLLGGWVESERNLDQNGECFILGDAMVFSNARVSENAYKTKTGEFKVQFQIGYKGLLELAQRSGKIKTLYAHEVRENDEFDIDYGLEQKLVHKPLLKGDRGEVIGYYAVYHLDNGGYSFNFMTKSEILDHAKKFSKTYSSGPWQTDFDAMAKKTVIKQLLKYAPLSIELQKAMAGDETVKSQISDDMSLIEDETESIDAEFEVKEDTEEIKNEG